MEALRAGLVTFGKLRLAIWATYGIALLMGAWLVVLGGIPVLVVGLTSIAASLLLSSGPFPLGDNAGLGDPLFFVFFDLVSVTGTYYVQAVAGLGGPRAPRWWLGRSPGTGCGPAFRRRRKISLTSIIVSSEIPTRPPG